MKWPEEVPVLTADDICKGAHDGPGGTHCLMGWTSELGVQGDSILRVLDAVRVEAGLRGLAGLVSWNDDPDRSKAEIARTWNRAMVRLGYTEGNPEKNWATR